MTGERQTSGSGAAAEHARVVWVALHDPQLIELNPTAERVAHAWTGSGPARGAVRVFIPRLVADALTAFTPRTLIGIYTEEYDGFEDVGYIALADVREALALAARIAELVKRAGDSEGQSFGYSSFEVEAARSTDPPATPVGQATGARLLHAMYVRDEAQAGELKLDGVIEEQSGWAC